MAHRRRPYRAPGTKGPVTENPIPGRDPGGKINAGKGTGANFDRPAQYGGPGAVTENPLHVDDRADNY